MFGIKRTIGRIKVGFALTRDSALVLRHHPKLAVLPAVSGVATIGFLVAMLAPLVVVQSAVGLESLGEAGVLALLFAWYFGTTFIASFFNGALVHATGDVFAGKEPSLKRSLRAAAGEVKMLLAWSAIAAVVGVVLKLLESSDSILADLVRIVVAVGWTVMTFFVIPVIMFEDTSVRGLFRESGRTFKETWGESLGVGIGITVAVTLATFALLVPAVGASLVLGFGPAGILLVVAVLVLSHLVYTTIWGVVKTALYGYAQTGSTPAEFDDLDFGQLEGDAS